MAGKRQKRRLSPIHGRTGGIHGRFGVQKIEGEIVVFRHGDAHGLLQFPVGLRPQFGDRHGNFGQLSPEGLRREILWAQAQYAILRAEAAKRARERGVPETEIAKIPVAPVLFRFPYGRCRPEALAMAS